ncbi:MAG TPA: arginine--tRNA ligase [Candidatus Kapabacteria bacterium]|nr:arginine--tRNA ligase [Candidatus Kapabacteria bacterium]
MTEVVRKDIQKMLKKAGVTEVMEFTVPPKREMGDIAMPCFALAKAWKKSPADVAKELAEKCATVSSSTIQEVKAVGPYLNFFVNDIALATDVLKSIGKEKDKYGRHVDGKKKKVLVEFAQPNTHKAFHIGHLRNIVTGESIARIMQNSGYKVVRVNFQGDVGMHIAKCLWGIFALRDEYEAIKEKTLDEQIAFLGKAYAHGAKAFEEDASAKEEIIGYNEKVYVKDPSIRDVYETTRAWSLSYFDRIYRRLGTGFDRLYFESEVFERGREIVKKFVQKGVFMESEGAVIFPGSQFGLHDRVFLNSKGFPTYEAKDVGLAEQHLKTFKPEKIIHVVAKEQIEYFKVVFKALESVFPQSTGKEYHLPYGWVQLKEGKMSSRTGNVILAEWLIQEVKQTIASIAAGNDIHDKEDVIEKVSLAAVKYGFLKTGVQNDIAFDLEESVSTSGDSGPYLLYIVARIKSILRKADVTKVPKKIVVNTLAPSEKEVMLQLAGFPEVTRAAGVAYDPSLIAKYVFSLAQAFNTFYHDCPVLHADETTKQFRLQLIAAVEQVMINGLYLLGIETVEEM